MHYDLLVIGSGPAATQGAIAAAKLNKRVAIVARNSQTIDGGFLPTGRIPLKTVREAILYLAGRQQRDSQRTTMDDLRRKLAQLMQQELDAVGDQLERYGVENLVGEVRFISSHEVEIDGPDGWRVVQADKILVACGTRPLRPGHIPFDGRLVVDADEIFNLNHIPRSMVVVGGGVTGLAYATMFAALGVQVILVDGREQLLDFCDREIVDALLDHARSSGLG